MNANNGTHESSYKFFVWRILLSLVLVLLLELAEVVDVVVELVLVLVLELAEVVDEWRKGFIDEKEEEGGSCRPSLEIFFSLFLRHTADRH